MRRSTFIIEKKKNQPSNRLRTGQKAKDENIPKYNELNQEINKLIRTIKMQFDFKTFTKERLQPLEEVSISFKKIFE